MAPPVNDKKPKNRRRKKRRTEDFSSDSDSDSDSSSSQDEKPEAKELDSEAQPSTSIDIKDVDIDSDNEEKDVAQNEPLSREELDRVKGIKFTSLDNQSSAEAKETLIKDKQQLENEYLALMATSFANDIDELRKKPDFSEKSVVMLAKALQSGSNMFDEDALDALLNK